jgi:hypothetical protein
MQGNEERKRDHSHAEDDEESDLVEEDQLAEAAVDEDLEPSLDSIPSNRRGRPKIPVTWSRVLHVTPELSTVVKEQWVAADLVVQKALMEQYEPDTRAQWKMLFHPKVYAKEHSFETLDTWKLSTEQLHKLGKQVTKLRADIRKRAE